MDKYFEARAAKTNDNQDIFETAADALKSENVQLKTLEEIAEVSIYVRTLEYSTHRQLHLSIIHGNPLYEKHFYNTFKRP